MKYLMSMFVILGWSKTLGDQIGVKMATSRWQEIGTTIAILRALLCLHSRFKIDQ